MRRRTTYLAALFLVSLLSNAGLLRCDALFLPTSNLRPCQQNKRVRRRLRALQYRNNGDPGVELKFPRLVGAVATVALAGGVFFNAFGGLGFKGEADQPGQQTPLFDEAVRLIRVGFYDNTGGAVYSRTPAGIDDKVRKIRQGSATRRMSERSMVQAVLDNIDDPFSSFEEKMVRVQSNGPGLLSSGAVVVLPKVNAEAVSKPFSVPENHYLPPSSGAAFPSVSWVLPGSPAERSGVRACMRGVAKPKRVPSPSTNDTSACFFARRS